MLYLLNMNATKGILNVMACKKVTTTASLLRVPSTKKYFSSQDSQVSSLSTSKKDGTENKPPAESAVVGEKASIGKAMQAYLKRATENQEFMLQLEKEFVFGRRHLANMMGKDPESFTQKDVDEAIRYLFPSGLYEKRARPIMRPPTEIYPKQKAAQFDLSGRPYHPFFYTAKPGFYFLLHEMVGKLNSLNKISPSVTGVDLSNDSALAGTVWINKAELEEQLLEKITDEMYNEFLSCFERLASHPKRERELDFIHKYRKALVKQVSSKNLPPVTLEPDGRKSVHVPYCAKKTARGDVLVTVPGTGQFKINGKGLEYFKVMSNREAVIAPLQLVGWLGQADVEANVIGGTMWSDHLQEPGETARAMCVRWGIATGLAALGADVEKLRLAGYLTPDKRQRERNKIAHDGARAAWTWKKR